ncbi:MAG: LOG family protein [Rhodospirillales bacterium]|nr:LOG family protein [Rhodospirillales bacterium]
MAGNDAQLRSRSYLLAVEDREFLLRDELRAIRFALEYAKPELALRDWGVRSTIVVFGSARIRPENGHKLSRWYDEAREFGRIVSLYGGALRPVDGKRDNVIATGGGPGIMEAANRGASDVGAPSIGFNITLPHEQEPNAFSTPELTFRFHYFAMRKMHLAMRANGLAVFPGGFGTMDELFEILTLQQTEKAPTVPVVLVGRDYWERVIRFDTLLEYGMLGQTDLNLFDIVDTAVDAWNSLVRRGLKAHSPPESAKPA